MRVVAALGGNALSPSGGTGSVEEMRQALEPTARVLADLVARGVSLVLTHGNGPQVGRILLQQEAAAPDVPPMPMDVCGAESQGQIGYLLAQSLDNALRSRRAAARALCLVTQVLVDGRDPAFRRPTKPVGPSYDEGDAKRIASESGHVFHEVAAGRWRRVVASPLPVGIVEEAPLLRLIETGSVVIAAGGGGVPVVSHRGRLVGVEAVVDKDRTAARLASLVGADLLLILTDVPHVLVAGEAVRELPVARAAELLAAGEFPEGSMGPKVEACVDFVRDGGGRAVITSLAAAGDAVFGGAGTSVVP